MDGCSEYQQSVDWKRILWNAVAAYEQSCSAGWWVAEDYKMEIAHVAPKGL